MISMIAGGFSIRQTADLCLTPQQSEKQKNSLSEQIDQTSARSGNQLLLQRNLHQTGPENIKHTSPVDSAATCGCRVMDPPIVLLVLCSSLWKQSGFLYQLLQQLRPSLVIRSGSNRDMTSVVLLSMRQLCLLKWPLSVQ